MLSLLAKTKEDFFMFDFFAFPTTNSWDEDIFQLTAAGIVTVAILMAALVAAAILLRPKAKPTAKSVTKQLVFSGAALALAMVTSEFIPTISLPFGGSITLFSMLFVVLIGYWYGAKAGLLTGFAYGLLQFVIDPKFYSPIQLLVDYPLAFGALGLSGFFSEKKHGLLKGYIAGILGRYVFAFLSGALFFAHYAPTQTPLGVITYSLGYNASYIFPEAVATVAILAIPAVKNAFARIKSLATG